LDETHSVVEGHLLDFLDRLPYCKVVVSPVELVTIIDECKEERVEVLVLRVNLERDLIDEVVLLNSYVPVASLFTLNNHKHVGVMLLNVIAHLDLHVVILTVVV
jgi:hypothetical protein